MPRDPKSGSWREDAIDTPNPFKSALTKPRTPSIPKPKIPGANLAPQKAKMPPAVPAALRGLKGK